MEENQQHEDNKKSGRLPLHTRQFQDVLKSPLQWSEDIETEHQMENQPVILYSTWLVFTLLGTEQEGLQGSPLCNTKGHTYVIRMILQLWNIPQLIWWTTKILAYWRAYKRDWNYKVHSAHSGLHHWTKQQQTHAGRTHTPKLKKAKEQYSGMHPWH